MIVIVLLLKCHIAHYLVPLWDTENLNPPMCYQIAYLKRRVTIIVLQYYNNMHKLNQITLVTVLSS